MNSEINTGGGASIDGDVGTGGGDFAGRDRNTTEVTVNIPMPTWPNKSQKEDEELSSEAELRLQSGINNLHREVSTLAGTITVLTGTLNTEIASTKDNRTDIKELVKTLSDTITQQSKAYDDRIRFVERAYEDFKFEREKERIMRDQESKAEKSVFDQKTSRMIFIIGVIALILLMIIAWGSLIRNPMAAQSAAISIYAFGEFVRASYSIRLKLI